MSRATVAVLTALTLAATTLALPPVAPHFDSTRLAPPIDIEEALAEAKAVLPGPAHAALVAAGSEAVTLFPGRSGSAYYVRAERGGVELTLVLDTGAGRGLLDAAAAARPQLAPVPAGARIALWGKFPVGHATVRGLRVCGVELAPAYYSVTDIAELSRVVRSVEGFGQDGMLGFDTLAAHSAVIDLPARRLYLLDPGKREPGLWGEWVCDAHARRGDAWADPEGLVRLRIGGATVSYSADRGKTFTEYGLVLDPKAKPKQMDWVASNGGAHLGIDRYTPPKDGAPAGLTIALPFAPGDDFAARPAALVSGKGARFITLTLRPKVAGD